MRRPIAKRIIATTVPIIYFCIAGSKSRCNAWSIAPLTVMTITAMEATVNRRPIRIIRIPLALLFVRNPRCFSSVFSFCQHQNAFFSKFRLVFFLVLFPISLFSLLDWAIFNLPYGSLKGDFVSGKSNMLAGSFFLGFAFGFFLVLVGFP